MVPYQLLKTKNKLREKQINIILIFQLFLTFIFKSIVNKDQTNDPIILKIKIMEKDKFKFITLFYKG